MPSENAPKNSPSQLPSQSPSQPPSEYPTMAPQSDLETMAHSRSEVTVAPPAREVSKYLSRYVLKNFHARGGMGEVWVSEDPAIGREVAIKRLAASGGGAADRFIAEAQITGQLEHPSIVPVHDMGEDELGRPFYVMKFVRGKSLKQTILDIHGPRESEGNPTELQRSYLLNVFVGICHAVAYAHSRGVLHRDIKPDNIMVGEYGEIVLLDWGLAKLSDQPEMFGTGSSYVRSVSGSLANTEAGSILGSPLYMPPEMAEGRIPDTDERTDIYLLGATLYEILTGRPPREGRSRTELLDLARTVAPVPPRKLTDVDKAIDAICLKAMSREKADRYASASALIDDLQRYLVSEPVSAYREGWAQRTWRWCKRHRVALQRSAAAFVIVASSLIIFAKWRQLDARQRLAQAQAAQLQQREQARQQIQAFDHLLDEARFYAASTDPVAEHAPYFDSAKARIAEQAALAAASDWGPDLSRLVLPEEAPRLRNRLYELLLLMTQSTLQSTDTAAAADARSLLDRAALLNPNRSRGYYRLSSAALARLNDPGSAAQSRLALDPATPSTAFDFFLLGEAARRQAVSKDTAMYNGLASSPDRNSGIEQAVTNYSRALELDPTLYWAQFQLGRCYLSLGRTAEAVQALGTCIALRPDAPWSYSARGMALAVLGKFDQALADLNHALTLDPGFLPALLNRGAVHWMQNDTKEALADFSRILEAPEDHRLVEAAFYRAQIYIQSNDLDDALSDLNTVIAQQPDFAEATLLRGRVQLLKGNPSTCLADLDRWLRSSRGIDFSPTDTTALMERGELLRAIAAAGLPPDAAGSALELARQDVDAALQLGEHSSRVHGDKGAILDLLGDTTGAISEYSLSLQADPQNTQSQINRAWAYQKAGNLPASAQDFQAVIHLNPESAEAHAGLAYVQACRNEEDSARDEASHALLSGSTDYLILHNVACVYAQLAEDQPARRDQAQEVAISLLQKAIQLCKLNAKGPDEIRLIQQEPAFSASFRARPEFQLLLNPRN